MCLCVAVLVWREFLVVMRIVNRSQSSLNEKQKGNLGWRQDHRLRIRWLLWIRLNLKGDFFISWRSDLHWLSFVLGSKAWLLTVSPQPSVKLRALSVSPASSWELTLCSWFSLSWSHLPFLFFQIPKPFLSDIVVPFLTFRSPCLRPFVTLQV